MQRGLEFSRVMLIGAVLVGGAACKRLKEDKPYTPFGIASAVPAAPAPAESAATDAASPPTRFAVEQAILAPEGARGTWLLGKREIAAPKGRVFSLGLQADFNADDKLETVAWTVPEEASPRANPGELWLYPEKGSPRRLAKLPTFVPSHPTCALEVSLTRTGPSTLTLDTRASCEGVLLARSPVRGLMVVRPLEKEPVLLTLRVTEPAPGELFEVEVDSTDRDHDGRDDVEIHVSVGKEGAGELAKAPVRWFDRAAGLARDPAEPGLTLAQNASREVVRARGAATSKSVRANVGNQRRLMSALCLEGGVPRVLLESGTGIPCGPLPLTTGRLLTAEFNAAVNLGQVDQAAAILGRADWYFDRVKDSVRQELEQRLLQLVEQESIAAVSPEVRAVASSLSPHFSPLWFEHTGTLLVKTDSGLARVKDGGRQVEPVAADAGDGPWPAEVLGPAGETWIGTTLACNHSELLFELGAPGGARLPPVPTGLLAPRPGACGARGGAPALRAAPIAFTRAGLRAIVAGTPVGSELGPGAAVGSPISPDGQYAVWPSPWGLLITGGKRPKLWRLEGAASTPIPKLDDCVVASGATAVACTSGTKVFVLTPRP